MRSLVLSALLLLAVVNHCAAQAPTIKWWYDLLDASFGQSAAGDIDKDGTTEIVFGCYRNDSCIYALNAENGSLQWKFNAKTASAEGCNDAAILIADTDNDDTLDVVVTASCNPTTYCFRGKNGAIKWQTPSAGSDSPPSFADVDNDTKPEVLFGGFDGKIRCLNAENGTVAWTLPVFGNAWVQTAPTLTDIDNDGQLDVVAATWAFHPDTSRVYAFNGANQSLMWSKPVSDYVYHGTAVGDIDNDGKPELLLGDYSGKVYAINAEDGSSLWTYQAQVYVGAPVTIADVDLDGFCDVLFCDAYGIGALNRFGSSIWYYAIPNYGQSFRGVAVADVSGDAKPDIVFGTQTGSVYALNGANGALLWSVDLKAHIGKDFDIDNAPLISDFDHDGHIDVFIVGGKSSYPNFSNNYGRAYMLSCAAGSGPDWMMFQHDEKRLSNVCQFPLGIAPVSAEDELVVYPNPTEGILHLQGCSDGEIVIYSMSGLVEMCIAATGKTTEVNIRQVPDGLHLFTFKNKKGISRHLIVKAGLR